MSIKIMTEVWDSQSFKGNSKLIMLCLADFANDEGVCWPSHSTVAKKCCISASTVKAQIKQLIKAGWLSSQERKKTTIDGKETNDSNIYQIDVRRLKSSNDTGVEIKPRSKSTPGDRLTPPGSKSDYKPSLDPSLKDQEIIVEFEPKPEPDPDPETEHPRSEEIKIVIGYLNEKTNSRFQAKGQSARFVSGRLNDGNSVQDLIAVIDCKYSEWSKNAKMCQFLRPSTLFGAEKFPGYLLQANSIDRGVVVERDPDWIPDDTSTDWARDLEI